MCAFDDGYVVIMFVYNMKYSENFIKKRIL